MVVTGRRLWVQCNTSLAKRKRSPQYQLRVTGATTSRSLRLRAPACGSASFVKPPTSWRRGSVHSSSRERSSTRYRAFRSSCICVTRETSMWQSMRNWWKRLNGSEIAGTTCSIVDAPQSAGSSRSSPPTFSGSGLRPSYDIQGCWRGLPTRRSSDTS